MIDVGVVCEGGNDFIVLSNLIEKELSPAAVNVVPIQPMVDATLRQVSGGGYTEVKLWCLQNSGSAFYDKLKAGALFNVNAPLYDYIIIHLDGDVLEKSGWFSPAQIGLGAASVSARVMAITDWIERATGAHDSTELICAVPVLQTDAWVLAGVRPSRSFEKFEQKERLSRLLCKFVHSDRREALLRIMPMCASNRGLARANNTSLDLFLDGLS